MKDNKARFVIELDLKPEIYQMHILDKRFNVGQKMYNMLLNITSKRYNKMINDKRYKIIQNRLYELYDLRKDPEIDNKELRRIEKEIKKGYTEQKILRNKFHLSEYAFHDDITAIQHKYKNHVDSFTAQKIASQQWKAYEKIFFGKGKQRGKRVHYKKYGTFNTFEGKSNKTGIRFFNDVNLLTWKGLIIPVNIDPKNKYEFDALQNEIAYCRIVRKMIRGKYKYYVQIILKGTPPDKRNRKTGEFKNELGNGDVGIDIGTQTIAIVTEDKVQLLELADKVNNIEKAKCRIQRKMDRSRRAMNPDNFNTDGTIKKQGNKKVNWQQSKRYLRDQNKLRELHRKQAAVRKYQHECLANRVIESGNKFYVETMDFKSLQQRIDPDKVIDTNKKSRKRFGKSIANKAPAMFLTILERKLKKENAQLNRINTYAAKASQFDHTDQSNTKKKLSQRFTTLSNDICVQRDLYSAFLIMNINEDLKTFNQEKCDARFIKFIVTHDLEIMRLRKINNLSSMGV